MNKRVLLIIILFFIFILALFFRVYFCYDIVFSEPIRYSADDGVYHMRLIENELLGNHFPSRLYFEPFTYFPYATNNNVAPLYDQIISFIIWLISFGKPTLELINKIAPFYPAVLGSLAVFLAYFIGKSIWGKAVGIASAFLLALSPIFLFRSLLGSVDHHVAEVFFSAMAMMFLIFSLQTEKNKRLFWLFAFLTGVSLGLYLLTWSGGLLFVFIIFAFIVLRYLIDFLTGRFYSNLSLKGGMVIFLIALIIILLYFRLSFFYINAYNLKHFLSLVLGIAGLFFLKQAGLFVKKKELNKWLLPSFLFLGVLIFLVLLKAILPSIFNNLSETFLAIRTGLSINQASRETVSEMIPIGFGGAVSTFSSLFFLFLTGLGLVIYNFVKSRKPEYLLVIVWSLIILLMTGVIPFFGARRYNYYLSFNISLLAGFLAVKGFQFGWKGLRLTEDFSPRPELKPYLVVAPILVILNVIFFLVFPFPFNIGASFPGILPDIVYRPFLAARGGPYYLQEDWYESFEWMKENTPDPGIDYYGLYNKENFSYPEESYGVLARWDVGHALTYYSHRIPVSNPFQQGMGTRNGEEIGELGEGVFFLETSEEAAVKYLDKLKVKYIIIDYDSVDINSGIFATRVKWVQGNYSGYWLEGEEATEEPNKFDNSMVVRLHILDGSEETTQREVNGRTIEFYIKPLDHFRLVWESENSVMEDIKFIKIFEYVRGAKISGRADSEVVISINVKTNQDRELIYEKTITPKDGYFETVVPYNGKYNLKMGNKETEFEVKEEDVLEGRTITLSM